MELEGSAVGVAESPPATTEPRSRLGRFLAYSVGSEEAFAGDSDASVRAFAAFAAAFAAAFSSRSISFCSRARPLGPSPPPPWPPSPPPRLAPRIREPREAPRTPRR